jgi:hypothetical protein
MSKAVTISGTEYTISGTVKKDGQGVLDLHVEVYDKDLIKDDFLGLGVTDASGAFSVSFDVSKFQNLLDRQPDLYFVVIDYGETILNTKKQFICNATVETPPIELVVNKLNDRTRALIHPTTAEGWVGGFRPDLSTLEMQDNLANISKLQRQQKVVWPEFSWNSEPDAEEDKKRCFQMFAPDISRLGYTDEGQVFSIICPQQGFATKNFGSLNVEVTVTGNKGWADEPNRKINAEMSVVGKIWFAPSAKERRIVKLLTAFFKYKGIKFPGSKENAIVIETFKPGTNCTEKPFPLVSGQSTDFEIPNFAKHEAISWDVANLGVEIGGIVQTSNPMINKFNQLVLNAFNAASGNMLKKGNTLYWNVWFTSPELVDTKEWEEHAEKWRTSIQADHGSPDGLGTRARYFDGTPFRPIRNLIIKELPYIIAFVAEHIGKKEADDLMAEIKDAKEDEVS